MRKLLLPILLLAPVMSMALTEGHFVVKTVAPNAVRIRYVASADTAQSLPDWLYVKHEAMVSHQIQVSTDEERRTVEVKDASGKVVFHAVNHQLIPDTIAGEPTHCATLSFASPDDECLFGLGQFQDGYNNVRGLSRRLTQVNTQISIPMLISSKGYGVLWNNYGLTDGGWQEGNP